MIGVYPFMLYPGVVMAHPDLSEDQWSLLTPEGVFNENETLSRGGYTAMWENVPEGGVGYEARCEGGKGPVQYGIKLVPGEDVVDLELRITNCQEQVWKEVMADICLMNIRAPHFYDGEYRRTFVIGPSGLTHVSEFIASPKRPVFRRKGRKKDALHFYWPENSTFWNMTDVEISGDIVLTQSVDGEWTAAFGWEALAMVSCNTDAAHGCVHANPHLTNIPAGGAGTVRGKIYIAHQRPEEVVERFVKECGT